MDNPSLDIFDLVHIFYKSRKMIALIVIVVAIAAVIYSLLATQYFKSRASFYPVGKGSSGLPIDIPGLSGITSSLLGGEDTQQAEGYIEVMKSRIFSEDVIRKFDLIQYFKLKNPDPLHNMDNALKYLAKDVVSFSYESGTGLLIITASTKSKQLSLDIVNFYLIKIDEYNRHQKITQGKLNRQFLEQRVNETKASLDSLIIVNQKFQEGSKAINLESQAKTLVDAYGALVAESMKLDIELKLARANYGSSSPVIANLELRRTELDKQIKDLEHSGNTPEYLINIGKIPGVSAQYARIQMNIEIYKSLFSYLYPQYEAARLSELRDMPTIELLDTPRLAGRRDRPRRAIICIVSTIAAFILALALAMLKEIALRHKNRLKEIFSSVADEKV
jgi:uncharacterized protein involved in exopolysaccharide biosynthesis